MRRPPAALPFLLVTAFIDFIDILGLGMVVPFAPGLIIGLGGGSITVGLLVAQYGLLQWLAAPVPGLVFACAAAALAVAIGQLLRAR
jgi:hypothetical protein